ncbi:c-type cytochrome [Polymorphobacter sp.]|uniref:c-type cytochrome n=1 Tax=Polymorphobacter sp. TaxID=1909290 RepID=UPI003F72F7EE
MTMGIRLIMPLAAALLAVVATPALAVAATPALAQPAPDKARGKLLFLQCAACHSVAKGAPHKIGPNLHGIVGAPPGERLGFRYSAALAGTGLPWTEQRLDAFIASPARTVPGTRMAFGGIADPAKRRDLLAYLMEATR